MAKERIDELIKRGVRLARTTDCCIALITKHYVNERWHHRELGAAALAGKPMFAFVERGVDWSEYGRYPWVMVFEFDRENIGECEPHIRKIREWMEENAIDLSSS